LREGEEMAASLEGMAREGCAQSGTKHDIETLLFWGWVDLDELNDVGTLGEIAIDAISLYIHLVGSEISKGGMRRKVGCCNRSSLVFPITAIYPPHSLVSTSHREEKRMFGWKIKVYFHDLEFTK
jgi:hypothetical protein